LSLLLSKMLLLKKINNISNPIFIPSALSGHIEEIKYVLFNNLQWEKILKLKVL
jgi:hypothetical protein